MRVHYARSLSLLSAAVLIPAFAGFTAGNASAAPAHRPAAKKTSVTAAPMTFARNEGQAPGGVRYLGASAGVGVAFTDSGVSIDLTRSSGADSRTPSKASVTLRFVHAARHPEVTGAQRSSAVVNDFHGADPARWHTGIPTFGQVVYHDLWPGIDGIFSVRNGTLKYSFALDPGADPDDIRLSYAGADRVSVDRGGDLAVTTGRTVLHDQAPVSYQGAGRVTTGYRLLGGTDFGFTLARYRHDAPLTLDPGLDYSTYLGSTDGMPASSFSVGHDDAGNLYVFGQSSSPAFPTTQTSHRPDGESPDFVVAKLDPTGSRLIYSTFVGGSGAEAGSRGAVGGDGAVYVSGVSSSADFPTTTGAFRKTPYQAPGQSVAFKLDPAGSRLAYGTYLAPDLTVSDVEAGADGSLTVGGSTTSDYAPTTADAYLADYPGGQVSGYLVRLDPAGSDLLFGTYLGAPITDQVAKYGWDPGCYVYAIAVDHAGATYATGGCVNGLPTTPGGFQATKKGLASILVKLDPTGHEVDYATYIGDLDSDIMRTDGVAVDRDGHAWVVGDAPPGSVSPTPDAYATECVSAADYPRCATLTEFDGSGHVVHSTYFAAAGDGQTTPFGGVEVDDDGRVYVAGMTGPGLPTTPDAYSTTPGGYEMPYFLAVFENHALRYSTYFGGTSTACAGALCGLIAGFVDIAPDVRSGSVYLAGTTTAPDFPVTPGAFQTTYPGGSNTIFAAKLTLPWATPAKPTASGGDR
ncbi:hypothetical protein [Actinoallomurus iriomotensis]|uniref:DUF7948 domain-containing protein n=1 Tax=Actinoallomurus iriomotensis TaxID=478107 RepID=A0A9W6RV29_9ACTN|nr:hypothetical protein [Actinoallomurus iriomotensis]GLY82369.1 hypothetical protein Airi02_003010 [Actinoallomurus iriomotensis]